MISKVPATLHTPLMSGANAIHGVVVVGVMLLAATADDLLGYVLLFIAAAFAAMNVVGGYLVTDRMLEMFKPRPHRRADRSGCPSTRRRPRTAPSERTRTSSPTRCTCVGGAASCWACT